MIFLMLASLRWIIILRQKRKVEKINVTLQKRFIFTAFWLKILVSGEKRILAQLTFAVKVACIAIFFFFRSIFR